MNIISEDTVICEMCGLLREQPGGVIEDGETNDNGWWCRSCVSEGFMKTVAEEEWKLFEEDYPEFAAELKALRQLAADSVP